MTEWEPDNLEEPDVTWFKPHPRFKKSFSLESQGKLYELPVCQGVSLTWMGSFVKWNLKAAWTFYASQWMCQMNWEPQCVPSTGVIPSLEKKRPKKARCS